MTQARDSFLFSYNGEYNVELNLETCGEHIKGDPMMSHCKVEWDCKCEDKYIRCDGNVIECSGENKDMIIMRTSQQIPRTLHSFDFAAKIISSLFFN